MGSGKTDPAAITAALDCYRPKPGLFVLGLCGAQGSGKSTLATGLAAQANAAGIATATLSLDDLYLTRAERETLARDVHPLLHTRGVPGTHDVALGLATIAALDRGEPARLPRFDKGVDDRLARAQWPQASARSRLLIFEGWCVGARPQEQAALRSPVNTLEAQEDRDGSWRSFANAALDSAYQQLFARIDALVLLAAPNFDVVARWRMQQEEGLRARRGDGARLMDAPAIARFVAHYERLTRHILAEMPARADLVIQLDEDRRCRAIRRGAAVSR